MRLRRRVRQNRIRDHVLGHSGCRVPAARRLIVDCVFDAWRACSWIRLLPAGPQCASPHGRSCTRAFCVCHRKLPLQLVCDTGFTFSNRENGVLPKHVLRTKEVPKELVRRLHFLESILRFDIAGIVIGVELQSECLVHRLQ